MSLDPKKKPGQLRPNAVPADGYVLSVDGKLKTRFDTEKDAMAAAIKLKTEYPVIQALVYDAVARSYLPVTVPDAKPEQVEKAEKQEKAEKPDKAEKTAKADKAEA
jgi:hypothetical protein